MTVVLLVAMIATAFFSMGSNKVQESMKNRSNKKKKRVIKENFDEKYAPKPNSSTKKSKLPVLGPV